jgi:hypothetical protein
MSSAPLSRMAEAMEVKSPFSHKALLGFTAVGCTVAGSFMVSVF